MIVSHIVAATLNRSPHCTLQLHRLCAGFDTQMAHVCHWAVAAAPPPAERVDHRL